MIVLDVETTGLNPRITSIVSVGAVYFENPEKPLPFYGECRIWDGAEIPSEDRALEVNGFTEEDIKSPAKLAQDILLKDFLLWTEGIKDKTLGGQNPSFDRDFIIASLNRYSLKSPFSIRTRTIDLHSLAYADHLKRGIPIPLDKEREGSNLGLNTILNYVGLPKEPRPHNALTGAKMEAEAIHRIIYCKPLLKEFSNYPVPYHLK
jgi:DNA polymerase III epsilon subunit-like protein